MADSNTPSKLGNKLDNLPKEELIKYIKKQVVQVKDLKKKNEELNSMLKHEKQEIERLTQEQKSWLTRGITAEFEKKEKIEKKERELIMAAQLGQQMLAENDELKQKCADLEKKIQTVMQEMNDIVSQKTLEKETMERNLAVIEEKYKAAKTEAQNMKDALEMAAVEQDKEHETWEQERKDLRDEIELWNKRVNTEEPVICNNEGKDLIKENLSLKEHIDHLQLQLEKFTEQDKSKNYEELLQINQNLEKKSSDALDEIHALNDSVKSLQRACDEFKAKNMELHSYVEMVNLERDESNNYAKKLHEDLLKIKEDKEKALKSLKILKGKFEKANLVEVEMKEVISKVSSEKSELQLAVKNLQREKKTLMQSNKKLKERFKAQDERRSSEELRIEKGKENENLKREIDELKIRIDFFQEDKKKISNENQDIIRKYTNGKQQLAELQEIIKQTKQDLLTKTKENEDEKALVSKLQIRIDELVSTLQSLNEEKMHQETEIEELFKAQDELQAKYDNECIQRKMKDVIIEDLRQQLEGEDQLRLDAYRKQIDIVPDVCSDSNSIGKMSDNEETTQDGYKTQSLETETDGDLKKHLIEKEQEIERLQIHVMRITEDLENEKREKRIVESNIRQNISSVEEFEENEKNILQMQVNGEQNESLKKQLEHYEEEFKELKEIFRCWNNEENDERAHEKSITDKVRIVVYERNELERCMKVNNDVLGSIRNDKASMEVELGICKNELAELQRINKELMKGEEEKGLLTTDHQAVMVELNEKQQRIEKLEDMIEKMNEELLEVNRLKDEIAFVRQERQHLEKQIEFQTENIEQFKKELQDKEKKNLEMEDQIRELNIELNNSRISNENPQIILSRKLQDSHEKINLSLSNSSDHVEHEKEDCIQYDHTEIQRNCTTTTHVEDWVLKEKDLNEKLLVLAEENQMLSGNITTLNNDIESMKMHLSDTKEKLMESGELAKKLQLEKEDMLASAVVTSKEIIQLKEHVVSLNSKMGNLENSFSLERKKTLSLMNQIDELKSENIQFEKSLSKSLDFISELQDKLEQDRVENGSLMYSEDLNHGEEPDLQWKEQKSPSFSQEETEAKKDYCSNEVAEKICSIAKEMYQQIMTHKMQSKMFSGNMKKLEASLDIEKQRAVDVNSELVMVCTSLEKVSNKLQMNEQKLSDLEKEKKEVNSLLNAKISESEISKQNAENLEIELDSIRFRLKQSDNDLNALRSIYEDVMLQCSSKDGKICEYEEIVATRNTQFEHLNAELSAIKSTMDSQMLGSEVKEERMNCLERELESAMKNIDMLKIDNNEKSEKINKLKSVAIKAKKEIDSTKDKAVAEKVELQNAAERLKGDINALKLNLDIATKDCFAYETKNKELQEQQNLLANQLQDKTQRIAEAETENSKLTELVDILKSSSADLEEQSVSLRKEMADRMETIEKLSNQISHANDRINELNDNIREEKEQHDDTKCQLVKINDDHETAMKDVHQMKMIKLEMQDCHRTVESLQIKLAEKEAEHQLLTVNYGDLKNIIDSKNTTISSLEEQYSQSNEEIHRMNMILKEKTEESNGYFTEKAKVEARECDYRSKIEQLAQASEDQTLQISNLVAEKEKIALQLRNAKDLHEREVHSLEVKISRAQTEINLLQEAYDNCKQEFDSYKVRAQNVLKQQKSKFANNDERQFKEEKLKLEQLLNQFKERLQDKSDQLSVACNEHEELQADHARLQLRYSNLMKDANENELEWKRRLTEIQTEHAAKLEQGEKTLKELTTENELMHAKCNDIDESESIKQRFEEEIRNLKEQLSRERRILKSNDSKARKRAMDHDSKDASSMENNRLSLTENSNSHPETTAEFSSGLVERPGAEGMDCSELEKVDKTSQPTTPAAIDSASYLEILLTPSDENPHLEWPSSATISREEGIRLRTSLSTAEKNVEHMSELLAESEGNNARWEEQVRVLKAEIRRMQQNKEREEALHNLEYLKNVVIKFMKCAPTEKECLVPVLSTMLKLSAEEKNFLMEYAKGGEANQGDSSSAWSSYVYRWTSFS